MAYLMMSERENIDGFWYYYLRCGGKWRMYVQLTSRLIRFCEDVDTLEEAKRLTHEFAQILSKMETENEEGENNNV